MPKLIDFAAVSTSDPKKCVATFVERNCSEFGHHFKSMLGQALSGKCTKHPDSEQCQDSSAPVDIFVSGFPCQPYSSKSNRSTEANPKSHPLYAADEVELVIKNRKPRIIVLENALGIERTFADKPKSELDAILQMLKKYGYHTKVHRLSGHTWHEGFRGSRSYASV